MRNEVKAAIVTAVLIMGIAVLFRGVLNKAQDVVPLFMVPAFVFLGYLISSAGFKAWLILTLAVTAALVVLYALP